MLDNYDSFTYNLARYFRELDVQVEVHRNDALTIDDIEAMAPRHLVISPGPCTPNEAGISVAAIKHFAGHIPILGVCLGHQGIGQAFGADVVRANQVMHGKTSLVSHTDVGVFRGLQNPLQVTRYHSLVLCPKSIPACLEVTAWSLDSVGERDAIMGVRHRQLDVEGVQFHPESVLTRQGHDLLANFVHR
jgi:anthranilate synthase/aminodeoxychorismate synthase-like glutamine amidotransferase